MTVRPGKRLLHAVAALSVIGLLAFAWGQILWLLAAVLPPLGWLAYRDARQAITAISGIKVIRHIPNVVGRDLEFENAVSLSHEGGLAVCGRVRDVFPGECVPQWLSSDFALAANDDQVSISALCRIPIRGRFRFGPIWIRVEGPLGLMEVQQEVDVTDEIKVLPETLVSRDELQKDVGAQLVLLDKVARARQVGAGTEFVSLFPYRLGDDPRRIDWRATARQRFPIVRRYQVERHRDVLILIDCGRLMGAMTDRGSKLDCAVDSALNLARVALHSGDRCGIGVFDSQLQGYLRPIVGPKSFSSLVECVFDLQTDFRETDFTRLFAELQRRQSKRSLLVIISDLGDAETSRLNCAALARLSQRHLVLFAALRTPLLQRVIHQPTTSIRIGAEQAVALGLARDRGRALFSLRHGGIHVVDVEPQQLTLPLVNQFVELRQRNLL